MKLPKINWKLMDLSIKLRNKNIDTSEIKKLEVKYKEIEKKDKDIRELMNNFDKENQKRKNEGKEINKNNPYKKDFTSIVQEKKEIEIKLDDFYRRLPNYIDELVPEGKSEADDKILTVDGELSFNVNHFDLNVIENVSEMCGTRFIGLKGKIATLHRALRNFYAEELLKFGSTEYHLPSLLLKESFYRSRHLPLERTNMFSTDDEKYFLVPTGEVCLVNLAFKKEFSNPEFVFACTPCFRKEAGAHGRDTRGMIRLHEFTKCEHVCFTPERFAKICFEQMIGLSYSFLKKFGLAVRRKIVCSNEMGNNALYQEDLEICICGVWRECGSFSDTGKLQSFYLDAKEKERTVVSFEKQLKDLERINGKNFTDEEIENLKNKKLDNFSENIKTYFKNPRKEKKYIHILNGSTLPFERILAAIIEKYYSNNRIEVPEVLRKYTNFDVIEVS